MINHGAGSPFPPHQNKEVNMKALSINQPWAWCCANGYKGPENRGWDTKFRGWFLIHAGKKFDDAGYDWIKDRFPEIPLPDRYAFESMMGGIVGKARLINTVHESQKHLLSEKDIPWFFGPYGFMLDSAEPCKLVPCKGTLGFFTPDYNSRYAEPKKKVSAQGKLI